MTRMIRRFLAITGVLALILGICLYGATSAQASVAHYYKVQDLTVNEIEPDFFHDGQYLHWTGHVYLRVRWETDNGPSPDLAHVDPIEGIHPISISNYTNRDIDVYYMIYSDVEFGVSGQYQATLFIPGNGGTVYPIISNAMWHPNPPTHWLQHRNAPRIGISVQPHVQPWFYSFDPQSMLNIVPNIPA